MGDEFNDAPAVRDWYASVWGDPDAAYYAGSLGDVFIPAGPGTAAKGAKGLAKLAKVDAGAAKGFPGIHRGHQCRTGCQASGQAHKAAQAAALGVANPVADIAAAVTPGRGS